MFVSHNFRASCRHLGINFQPARKATGSDKPHIERMFGSVASLFAQFVSGYTGPTPTGAAGTSRASRCGRCWSCRNCWTSG